MDDAPLAYDLRAPAAARGESITSQLQREIMGNADVPLPAPEPQSSPRTTRQRERLMSQSEELNAPKTPQSSRKSGDDDADLIAITTPEALSQKGSSAASQEPQEQLQPPVNARDDDRRRTLSPSKALAFFNQEGIRDSRLSTTTSRRDTVSPEAIRRLLHGLDESGASASSRRASIATALGLDPANESIDDNMLNEYVADLAGTKHLVEASKQTLAQSPTEAKRRRSPRGKLAQAKAKGATTDQDSFTDAFFSTTLMSRDEEDGGNENGTANNKQRRTTLEPTDAMSILSELRSEMMEVDEPPQDSRRATISTTGTDARRESPSPNTRSRKRRATLDPNDLMTMTDSGDSPPATAVAAATPANRRDTIDDSDLAELRREFGLEPQPTRAKTKSPSPAKRAAPGKRTRFGGQEDDDDDEPMTTPVKTKRQSVAETDTLFSPPPTNRGKTPLKSCMSARKAKPDQATPSKSVNFGPPQGAEFNSGSPPNSMTPLPSRDARAMFPLDEAEPPVSEDDDETSLNTSILDEADAQDSSDEEFNAAVLVEAQQRKLSVDPQRARRRYSLRGVSPLDNQANARRQRRLSSTSASTQPQSPLVSTRNRRAFEAAAAAAVQAKNAGPGPQRSSFLSASETMPRSRLAYADSSASSDEGEDMEITGDYSNHASTAKTLQTGVRESRLSESPRRSARIGSARQDSLFVDSPLSDTTMELGTLGDLVNETFEEEKKEESNSDMSEDHDDDDDDLAIGSLGDLAKEVEGEQLAEEEMQASQSSSQSSVAKFTASQEKTLDPIVEGDDEDRRSSSAHSMMSLDSDDDDSDAEYNAKRKSLVVNLASKFERFGSGSPKKRKSIENSSSLLNKLRSPQRKVASPRVLSQPPPSPVKLPDPLKTDEVLARVQLEQISREVVEGINMDVLQTDVQRSCVANAAASDLRFSITEIGSWVTGLADSLPALGHERVSRVFSTEDPTALMRMNESIQALHIMESIHVRSAYCQWRTKLEKRVCDKLVQCENNLASDAKTLRSQHDNDRSHRERELNAIRELLDREHQMKQLLDGIDEQRVVQRDYQASVQELESQCSSLSLEVSVLDQQLDALQFSSPQTDRTEATAVQLRREVLEAEELLAVRESIGLWRVVSASGSKLSIVSRYDDVLFSAEVRVSIDASGADNQSTFHILPVFTRKTHQQKRSQHDSHQQDAVSAIAATLLGTQQLQSYESTTLHAAQLPSQLTELSLTLQRAYQYLSDLRSISTVCGLELESVSDDERTLWIDFVRFPRESRSGAIVDGAKFRVGLGQQASWPFTNHETQVAIAYGTVTEEKIRQQLDGVPPQAGLEYVARVCRRLHDVFIQNGV